MSAPVKIYLLVAAVLLSSCARFFNAPDQSINISSSKNVKSISVNGKNLRIKKNAAKLNVYRDTIPLKMVVETADSTFHLSIKNKNSFNYILWGFLTGGIDWLIEKNHPKRYYYQKYIDLDVHENRIDVSRFKKEEKGSILLGFSIPYVNTFYLKTSNGHRHQLGFWGLSAELDYFYKQNHSLSVQAGIAMDYPVPVPVGIKYGKRDSIIECNTSYINLKNNHTIGSFNFGYGLNISKYKWSTTDLTGTVPVKKEIHTTAGGLSFETTYRFAKHFRIGLLYNASFLEYENQLNTGYQHLLTFQLQWKFRLK